MKKNETKKTIKNIVCLEGALTNYNCKYCENGNAVIYLTVCVENTKGHSFIPVVVFKDSYSDFEQLSKDLNSIEIPKYNKGEDDFFKDYLPKLENVYIEGELNASTYNRNTTIQVIANVVK